ncbi:MULTISPECIES: SIMPL domain-containing protein [unclassified Leptotrichia]|uniref:SIMPL domain-containing protein n=1 Tax=unclassified Leptotrichia TaxID=2633022 RepID=UPI00041EA56F|nr:MULTISPECIES: SIMPL domain-containing protein [unclassified Leptotrichia]WLD74603.1 SIMPL domain-containing protein [Leptotrichia sp. HMT-225]
MKKIAIALFSLVSILSFSANENIVRKISVTGNAEREVMPDLAKINFKIEEKGSNLSQTTNEVNKKIEKFKSELRARKISLENLETKAFYNRKGSEYQNDEDILDVKTVPNKTIKKTDKKPTSYDVNMSMLVKNTDFNKISALIDLEDGDNLQSIQKNFDENTFAFNINENGTTVDQALNKVFNKLNTSRRKLISAGIPESDIILSDYTIKENYTTDNKNSRKDVYYVTNEFVLTTKNIKELNTIISIADDNGININGSINFDLSDKDRIESEMYKDAYNQTKQKAESILRSSKMKLGTPIIVSEDVEFQQKMIDRIDQAWEVKYEAAPAPMAEYSNAKVSAYSVSTSSRMDSKKPRVDYTPKPLKLVQNISVMYEMK